ncbi:hypothetical protein CBR_g10830 [Chara braunii]|uniref:Reverse transcriptase domain-containing protein n=1 Tax=Chara braunii TaxID=69332 RepID=A0A388KPB4_CHABU|nr:hypothetical protein CBR_g10830 [Chara braunii]|eukprot:GBG71894.1 hypothetical protein CBR_g10830 [Chara braunii]
MLCADNDLIGLPLPHGKQLKSSAFADDTGAITALTPTSVRALTTQIEHFERYAGAKLNWHKSVALVPDMNAAGLFTGMRVQRITGSTVYLGIVMPDALSNGTQNEAVTHKAINRMASCAKRPQAEVFGRALLANTAASSMLWYAGAVSMPSQQAQLNYQTNLVKFVWKNDPLAPTTVHRVAWRKLIQPRAAGGLGLLDPSNQIRALHLRTIFWLILEDDAAPWKVLTLQTMAEAMRLHPADVMTALLQPSLLGNLKRGALWTPTLTLWRKLSPLRLRPPASREQILQQPLFDNPMILDAEGRPFPWMRTKGAFGRAWVTTGIGRVADIWDESTGDWKDDSLMIDALRGQTDKLGRLRHIQRAIPEEWTKMLRMGLQYRGEWAILRSNTSQGSDSPPVFFQLKAKVGSQWLLADAWHPMGPMLPTNRHIIGPMQRKPKHDGWIPVDAIRPVAVLRDKTRTSAPVYRAFHPACRSLS